MTEIDENIMVRVSKALITKTITKLDLNPATPAVYVVDQGLRELIKDE